MMEDNGTHLEGNMLCILFPNKQHDTPSFALQEGYQAAMECNGTELEGQILKVDRCRAAVVNKIRATSGSAAGGFGSPAAAAGGYASPAGALPSPPMGDARKTDVRHGSHDAACLIAVESL